MTSHGHHKNGADSRLFTPGSRNRHSGGPCDQTIERRMRKPSITAVSSAQQDVRVPSGALTAGAMQHDRLVSSGNRHFADIHVYVLAVDNLADTVRVMLSQYPQLAGMQTAVTDTLQRFTAAAPDIGNLRNLLEHFDEYDQSWADSRSLASSQGSAWAKSRTRRCSKAKLSSSSSGSRYWSAGRLQRHGNSPRKQLLCRTNYQADTKYRIP